MQHMGHLKGSKLLISWDYAGECGRASTKEKRGVQILDTQVYEYISLEACREEREFHRQQLHIGCIH